MQLPHGKFGQGINQIRVAGSGSAPLGAGGAPEAWHAVYTKGDQAGAAVDSKPMCSMKAASY